MTRFRFTLSLWVLANCLGNAAGLNAKASLNSRYLRPMQRVAQHAAAATAASESSAESGKSALVLGWFGAQDKELEFVKKIYKKKGFGDVVVQPSPIATCSKPRGWYRSVASLSRAMEKHQAVGGSDADGASSTAKDEALEKALAIGRDFDVVHVMSGGFLNLYLTLLSGVPLKFETLVLDSTPILPKPSSFTRFARAYMASMTGTPFALIPKIVPAWLHLAYVSARWTVSSAYVGLKHSLTSLIARAGGRGMKHYAAGTRTLGSLAPYAASMRYQRVVDHCIETIFGGRTADGGGDAKPLHAIFVHNPEDPYINNGDLKATIARARDEYGCTVDEVEVPTDHVRAIFRKPASIFSLTAPTSETDESTKAPAAAKSIAPTVADAPRYTIDSYTPW